MNTHADKTQNNKSQSVANVVSQKQSSGETSFRFVDNRPEAIAQRKLQEIANNSPQVKQLGILQEIATKNPQTQKVTQLQAMANNHSAQQQQPIIQMNSALLASIAEYFGVEATMSAVATALGITTTTLAMGLTTLGAVALVWSIPRIINYFSTVETQDTIHTIDVDSDSEDEDWTPTGVFRSRRQATIEGHEERTPLEAEAHEWDKTYTRRDVGPGTVSWRMGRGDQMFVQSRQSEYEDESVRVDYDDVSGILDEGTPEEIEQRGEAILQASLNKEVDFSTWRPKFRRAAAHLLGITQVAEEHESRSEGSALLARGGFQAVADGTSTFTEVFGRAGGQFTPAHIGGTEEMREVVRGEREPDQTLSGLAGDL